MGKPLEWSIEPKNVREISDEKGNAPYALLRVTTSGLVPLSNIHFLPSGKELVLPVEVQRKKQMLIGQRKQALAARHAAAIRAWEDGGQLGEPPQEPLFHDAALLRVSPEDVSIQEDEGGQRQLQIKTGKTTYFDYVATRDLKGVPYEELALPLACCGAIEINDKEGRRYALFSERTERVEAYPGYYHVIGGMISPDDSSRSPSEWWLEEVRQETGITPEELNVHGCFGVVMDTCWPHPELLYLARVRTSLDELFDKKSLYDILPKRTTDKEVRLKIIPLNASAVQSLLTGERSNGLQARPWVPTGLANMQLAGREWFGEDWQETVVDMYRRKLEALLSRKNRNHLTDTNS